jgi:hypothetical protein
MLQILSQTRNNRKVTFKIKDLQMFLDQFAYEKLEDTPADVFMYRTIPILNNDQIGEVAGSARRMGYVNVLYAKNYYTVFTNSNVYIDLIYKNKSRTFEPVQNIVKHALKESHEFILFAVNMCDLLSGQKMSLVKMFFEVLSNQAFKNLYKPLIGRYHYRIMIFHAPMITDGDVPAYSYKVFSPLYVSKDGAIVYSIYPLLYINQTYGSLFDLPDSATYPVVGYQTVTKAFNTDSLQRRIERRKAAEPVKAFLEELLAWEVLYPMVTSSLGPRLGYETLYKSTSKKVLDFGIIRFRNLYCVNFTLSITIDKDFTYHDIKFVQNKIQHMIEELTGTWVLPQLLITKARSVYNKLLCVIPLVVIVKT